MDTEVRRREGGRDQGRFTSGCSSQSTLSDRCWASGQTRAVWNPSVAGEQRDDQGGAVSLATSDRPTEESGEPYPPGYCHFPKYGEEYFKQLTAEQLVTRIVKGYRRPEWQKTRDRNEAVDARTYARSAAAVYGMDRFNDLTWKTLEGRLAELSKRVGQPTRPEQPAPPPQRTIRGRFFTDDKFPYRW
jgi:hypothetical protein